MGLFKFQAILMRLEVCIWINCTFYLKSIYTCDILAFNMPVES